MYKIKKFLLLSVLTVVSASAIVPIAANALEQKNVGIVRTFTSSYNDKDNYEYNDISMTCTCKLESTNHATSTLSTMTGDDKLVEVYIWNKSGDVKSDSASYHTASATTSVNPILFTPTNSLHAFYSTYADTEIDIWYN